MKLLEVVEDSAVFFQARQQERTPGLHLSDILKRIMVERDPERFSSPLELMRLEVGFTWEQIIETALANRLPNLTRIGEIESDGILMTPDALDPNGGHNGVLEEWKATWKTASDKQNEKIFEDAWYWFMQAKAYARRVGTRRIRVRVFYINGDYGKGQYKDGKRPPLLPQVWRYEVECTQRELDDNWRSILSYQKKFGLTANSPKWEEDSCQKTPSLTKTCAPTSQRQRNSAPPAPSSKRRVLTFRNTKRSKSRLSGS